MRKLILITLLALLAGCATIPQETIDANEQVSEALERINGNLDTLITDYMDTKWELYLAAHQQTVWLSVADLFQNYYANQAGVQANAYTMSVEQERLVGRVQSIVDDEIYNRLEADVNAARSSFQVTVVQQLNDAISRNLIANQQWNISVTELTAQTMNLVSLGTLVDVASTVNTFLGSSQFTQLTALANSF